MPAPLSEIKFCHRFVTYGVVLKVVVVSVSSSESRESEFGLRIAQQVANATDDEWLGIFYELLKTRQLSTAIRQMNQLLDHPQHSELAMTAFRRIGLEHGG